MLPTPTDTAWVVDTHVHLYCCYDIAAAIQAAHANLEGLARNLGLKSFVPAVCLTERFDHHIFSELKQGRVVRGSGLTIEGSRHPAGLVVQVRGRATPLILLAGRQIVTMERIEVLGLVMEDVVPDGLPLEETLCRVRAAGGIPVLSWAPGKWFGVRGRRVRDLIQSANPSELLLGDTSLRPWLWGEPLIMRMGRLRGLRVVSGSDPLPFPEDAAHAGRLASVYSPQSRDLGDPVAGIVRSLRSETPWRSRAGVRLSPISVFIRLLRNYKVTTESRSMQPT
ncbi:MAG: hypothetical protein BWY59_01499 [Verrucomicrobia bacterium ADurb.Bin345]|nr:MAG: hypothetical protein BWY59_01499 [Verrucomicrobia bacterium ADurb.Bin345]